jgi:hypothetical protein
LDYAVAIRASSGTQERGPVGEGKPLSANHPLYAGDTVETNEGSAVLRLPGIVLVALPPGSALRLDSLHGAPSGEGRTARLTLARGALWTRAFLPRTKQGARVEIDTGLVVVSFEHAELRLTREPGGVRVEALAGEARVRAGGRDLDLRAGQGVRILPGGGAPAARPLPPAPSGRAPRRGEVPGARLSWKAPAGAAGYLVEVAKDVDFLDLVATRDEVKTEVTLDLPAGAYYWRVRARDRDGFESVPWPIFKFTVAGPAAAPAPTAP